MSLTLITRAEREARLERARRRCFFFDVDDAGARLCRANMPFGLAKIHWMQEALGFEPEAAYLSTPDSTVTRNTERWRSGFGYGGEVCWSGDFVPLELKPNCCGMLVAGLREAPPGEGPLERVVERLVEGSLEVDGVAARWDMHLGNHFLNLYEVSDPAVTGGCQWVAIMHSSGRELRGPNSLGPGLYLGGPQGEGSLSELAEVIETPFGSGAVVRGEAAARYLDYVALVEAFALRRREAYARAIFGDQVEILFNRTHQGLVSPGRMLLGCYSLAGPLAPPWVPVTLRAELPAFLVAPGEIYAEATLEREGVLERARSEGCLDLLLRAKLLPHGGGYAYPTADGGEVTLEEPGPEGRRRFRVEGRLDWFDDVRELPFSYRGEEVIRRIEALGCGQVAARLELIRSLQPSHP